MRRGMELISRLFRAELREKVMGRVLLVSGPGASRKQSLHARSILIAPGAREARSSVKAFGIDIVEGMRKAFAVAARPAKAATLGSSIVVVLIDMVVGIDRTMDETMMR